MAGIREMFRCGLYLRSLYTPSVLCLDEDAELPELLNQAVHLCFSDAIGLL